MSQTRNFAITIYALTPDAKMAATASRLAEQMPKLRLIAGRTACKN